MSEKYFLPSENPKNIFRNRPKIQVYAGCKTVRKFIFAFFKSLRIKIEKRKDFSDDEERASWAIG